MEIAAFLIDFILHIDKHLQAFVVAYGPWGVCPVVFDCVCRNRGGGHAVFARRFAAVYCGGHVWRGLMDFSLAMVVLLVAAILGDQCNYTDWPHDWPRSVPVGGFALVQPPRV